MFFGKWQKKKRKMEDMHKQWTEQTKNPGAENQQQGSAVIFIPWL